MKLCRLGLAEDEAATAIGADAATAIGGPLGGPDTPTLVSFECPGANRKLVGCFLC